MQFPTSYRFAICLVYGLFVQSTLGKTLEDRYVDFHTSLTDTHQALSDFHGGLREGYNLLASMKKTRNYIKGSYNILDNIDLYSHDDVAMISNRTVEILPLVVDYFNLAATKLQYIPHERFRGMLRQRTNKNIDRDIQFLLKLRDYCDEGQIEEIDTALQDVKDAYFAIQKAI